MLSPLPKRLSTADRSSCWTMLPTAASSIAEAWRMSLPLRVALLYAAHSFGSYSLLPLHRERIRLRHALGSRCPYSTCPSSLTYTR